jgi:putative ABC transport system permease protein
MAGLLSGKAFGRTWHSCRKSPGQAFLIVVTAAIGIGSGVGMFTYMDTLLFKPLPFGEPEQLMRVSGVEPGVKNIPLSGPDFEDIQRGVPAFQAVAAYDNYAALTLGTGGGSEHVVGSAVSGNFFDLLRCRAWKGRTFGAAEQESRVAVLSYAFWLSRFGADAPVGSSSVALNGRTYAVIGVLPPDFWFPGMQESKLWIPLAREPLESNAASMVDRASHWLKVVARLKRGSSAAEAKGQVARISREQQRLYPESNRDLVWQVQPLRKWVNEDVEGSAPGLAAVGLLVIGIACANLGILVTLRILNRRRETATRLALGANRWNLFVEEAGDLFLLSVAGGAAGVALSFLLIKMTPIRVSDASPLFQHLSVDGRILTVFALAVVASSALAALGALAATVDRSDSTEALRAMGASAGSKPLTAILRAFMGCQIGLATVLIVGTLALYQSLRAVSAIHPGFDAQHVVTMQMEIPEAKATTGPAMTAYVSDILSGVRAVPGVRGVGTTSFLQFAGLHGNGRFAVAGRNQIPNGPTAERNVVSPGFFAAMGIPFLRGRDFTWADTGRLVIVSESLATNFLSGTEAVGQSLKLEGIEGEFRIIGVVGNTLRTSLSEATPYYTYLPYGLYPDTALFLTVRSGDDPLALMSAIKKTVKGIDAGQAMWNVATMEERVEESLLGERFNVRCVAVCSLLALLLAVIGVHGTVNYTVAARRKEIAVRMALGAVSGEIIFLFMREIMPPAVVGAIAGGGAALGLGVVFGAWSLVPVSVTPEMLGLAFLAVVAPALVAALAATLRSAKLEPMAALRD